jgi:hypothetical protein
MKKLSFFLSFSFLFSSLIICQSIGDSDKTRTTSPRLLAGLEPFIGDWYPDPDSAMLADFPEMANSIGFKLEWGRKDKNTLKFYEGVREGDTEKAILDCTVMGNPRTQEIEFQGYQNMNDFFYRGKFEIQEGGEGFTRQYDVYYPAGTEFRLKEDEIKGMKTYRDICKLTGDNSMECFTEQLEKGEWKPWGRGDKYLLSRKPIKGKVIPDWVKEHWEERTKDGGIWIADNSSYRSEAERFDAYGLHWQYGLGDNHLKGRLYCVIEGKDVATVWNFTEFWDPVSGKLKVIQIGSDGTIGKGEIWRSEDGKLKEHQVYTTPGGGQFESGHLTWMDGKSQHTQSYSIQGDEWTKQRFYVWRSDSK